MFDFFIVVNLNGRLGHAFSQYPTTALPSAPLSNPSSDEVVDLLARAFITTPMHAAAFGVSGEKELQLGRILWRAANEIVYAHAGRTQKVNLKLIIA